MADVHAGVGYEDVETAESGDGFRDHFADFCLLGDVGPDGDGLAARCLDGGGGGVDFVLSAGADADVRARVCIADGDTATNAASSTGDEGYFVGEWFAH